MTEENKTTPEHYKLFKSECRKWQPILGLQSWELFLMHDEIDEGSRAEIVADQIGRMATITLGIEWHNDAITDTLIKKTAFHEMMELLLAQLGLYGYTYFESSLIEGELHKIIRVMENVLFPKYDKPDYNGKCKK